MCRDSLVSPLMFPEKAPIIEVRARYGDFLVFTQSDVVSKSMRYYGEWAEHEIYELSKFVRPGTILMDGAQI